MTQTHTEWTPANSTVDAPRDKSASMMLLWIVALIAVAAAALAWYKQRPDTTLPLTGDTTPVIAPAQETAAPATPSADARRAEARRTPATPAARSYAARPLADNPTPKYPAAALRSGVGGTVMVRAEVDATGNPVDVTVVKRSGDRDLDRAALTAVRQWRFEPAVRNGKAVSSTVQVPVDFKPI